MTAATCPRCGGGFHCGAQEGRCDCFEIRLTEAQRAALVQQYDGCLCLRCLRELSQAVLPAPGTGALTSG